MEEGSLDDDLKITKGDTFPNYLAGHNRKKFTKNQFRYPGDAPIRHDLGLICVFIKKEKALGLPLSCSFHGRITS
jgi:hypothetical protein